MTFLTAIRNNKDTIFLALLFYKPEITKIEPIKKLQCISNGRSYSIKLFLQLLDQLLN